MGYSPWFSARIRILAKKDTIGKGTSRGAEWQKYQPQHLPVKSYECISGRIGSGKRISRVPEGERNGANFSLAAPSSGELRVHKETMDYNSLRFGGE